MKDHGRSGERTSEDILLKNGAFDQGDFRGNPGEIGRITGTQVIENPDLGTGSDQRFDQMGTDEARPTGDADGLS
jgi:hypothetical protein